MIGMFKKKPVLKYESAIEVYPEPITPSRNHIPQWYKKIPKWKDNKILTEDKKINVTMKQCMPFLDSLSIGYIITIPYDIYITTVDGSPYIVWKETDSPPRWRQNLSNKNVVPAGHYPFEYTWDLSTSFSVPKGYSAIFTHPFNRHDLPFTTLTGIIDGGFAIPPHGNFPFFVKTGFDGIIEKGTPIAQIIPFRQESWLAKNTLGMIKEGEKNNSKIGSVFNGWYKKTHWNRKEYN